MQLLTHVLFFFFFVSHFSYKRKHTSTGYVELLQDLNRLMYERKHLKQLLFFCRTFPMCVSYYDSLRKMYLFVCAHSSVFVCMCVCSCVYMCVHACMHVFMHMCVCAFICAHVCIRTSSAGGGQRTTFGSQSSPSTMWVRLGSRDLCPLSRLSSLVLMILIKT